MRRPLAPDHWVSDRFGTRGFATAGMAVFGGSFMGLMLPVDFPYWAFALLIVANGIGSGMFAGCEGWCAADVAGHVIGALRAIEARATGREMAASAADPRSAAGDDPLAAWRAARADMMAALDPGLVRDALEPARQFTPAGRAAGLVGPECAVAEDAGDLTRLLAIFGRSVS